MDELPAELATIRFEDGIPQVAHLPHDEIVNERGELYMRRYYLRRGPLRLPTVRIHEILLSDVGPLHDHPWDFTSWLLHGSYDEETDHGTSRYQSGDTLTRHARDVHRLTLEQPVWTFVRTGPVIKPWGFLTDDGWLHHREYERRTQRRAW